MIDPLKDAPQTGIPKRWVYLKIVLARFLLESSGSKIYAWANDKIH